MKKEKRLPVWLPWAILALGVAARLWLFGDLPGDLNQDEAFAGYEAWALLHGGMDTAGYRFPVYLVAWGSGMNALETYLMLPWVALFGLKVWVIRLPQLLLGILSLYICYLTAKRLFGERKGLLALLLLAFCPWHIMLSRWGLESNLAPGFLLLGFYCFLRGMDDARWYPLCALCYGLSLYTYATIWPVVPLLVLSELIYARRQKALHFDRFFWCSAVILMVLAAPLLLFLAVNYGWIEEIRGPIFSIPKLLYLRSGEISFKQIPENLKNLVKLLVTQSDGLPWNSPGWFGQLYPITLPFSLLGLVVCAVRLRKKQDSRSALLLMNLAAGLLVGLLVNVNVNRVNLIYIPLVLLAAFGFGWVCEHWKPALPVILAAYTVLFGLFCHSYFTEYRSSIGYSFGEGLGEAIAAVEDYEGTVTLSDDIHYPRVLFFSAADPQQFRDTVVYNNYPAAFLSVQSFDRWRFGIDPAALDPDAAYLFSVWTDQTPFLQAGYTLQTYGIYTLALPNG